MKKSTMIIIGIIVVVIIFLIGGISSYNGMISKKESVENSFSNLDVMLQRRADLVPNLVNSVKGYANHETEVIDKVTQARTELLNANGTQEKSDANNELTNSLNALMVVVENYPELKANQNFSELSEELRNTENKISFSRQFYNDTVTMYNQKLLTFPSNIIANMFNFKSHDLFKADSDEARKNVKIDFNK